MEIISNGLNEGVKEEGGSNQLRDQLDGDIVKDIRENGSSRCWSRGQGRNGLEENRVVIVYVRRY